jgi:hypothetical protein
MNPRRLLLFVVLTGVFAVSGTLLTTVSGQNAASPVGRTPSEAQYHSTEMAAGKSSGSKANSAPAARARPSSLATLSKIEILPSSIAIEGPKYSQRVIVEGTFVDGHEEELSSRVTLSISDSSVARIDKDDIVLPEGDGKATITATVQGHRASAPLVVSD